MVDEASADVALGARIAELRRQKQMTQEDFLALMAGSGFSWTRTVLSRIETGQRSLKAAELFAVAGALEIQVDDLNPAADALADAYKRQLGYYRRYVIRAADIERDVRESRERLVAAALAIKLRSGSTAFVVHGTPARFIHILASVVGVRTLGEALTVIGIDAANFKLAIERRKIASGFKGLWGFIFSDEGQRHGFANKLMEDAIADLLAEFFPGLEFVDQQWLGLSVDGLEFEN
ncbi:helix-turn-helix transcriptional regulator [Mycolicibacterium sp. lyk4-40-TYG-92]|uniref:helix-turn-helix domain-containing protein n=1 Tax=Mycolicibacterium sp. lyk4-40-TYG-92 TaxID=3040295 RepID=UPI00254A2E2F|nr:helix-turn-helix transcriptional regulator [Mycolicibacterium sp. lyk4-40-TYG-92]